MERDLGAEEGTSVLLDVSLWLDRKGVCFAGMKVCLKKQAVLAVYLPEGADTTVLGCPDRAEQYASFVRLGGLAACRRHPDTRAACIRGA